jgi:soluble lytic murein transglycosylase-like protein
MSWRSLRRQVTLGVCSAAAIITAASITRPVFVGRAPVLRDLVHRTRAADSARAPWLALPTDLAVRTPQFFADRQAFVSDLLRTGKVTRDRAWQLADVAVREAYTRRVPPALVLGVMLTENDEFKSTARSSAGALGLMQVHPKPWRVLERKFGPNLRNDSTNLKYGIFILGFLAGEAGQRAASSEEGWRKALLRYNGCVRGTNTPDCHRYPDVVRRNVIRGAHYSCGELDFESCVVTPLWMAKGQDGAAN